LAVYFSNGLLSPLQSRAGNLMTISKTSAVNFVFYTSSLKKIISQTPKSLMPWIFVPSSVSALVSKLEANELIERHESPDDKRVSLITLTDKGRDYITGSKKFKDELSESMFESLTSDEQQQLRHLLDKLIIDLEVKEPDWTQQHSNKFHGRGPAQGGFEFPFGNFNGFGGGFNRRPRG
jgi:DNA-binding PadR family transcriptional regulator